MRTLLATTMLVTLLLVGGRARADVVEDWYPGMSLLGRCIEQPMSLGIAATEHEAARLSPPRSLPQPEPAALTVDASAQAQHAPAHRPATRLICLTPDEPGCHVSAPPEAPASSQLERADHGFALAPAMPRPPPAVEQALRPLSAMVNGHARPGHTAPPWRPPAA